jgi:hypothetical protein
MSHTSGIASEASAVRIYASPEFVQQNLAGRGTPRANDWTLLSAAEGV